MNLIERIHDSYIISRRVQILAQHLAPLLPAEANVLDVGCGDGRITSTLAASRPDLHFEGLDVMARPNAQIPVAVFDGLHIPKPDRSYHTLLLIDVVHHAQDPATLLREAARVASGNIVLKDHLLQGALAEATLRFMDGVGNRRHGVPIPNHYWSEDTWRTVWSELELALHHFETDLGIYPVPFNWFFDRQLHFVAQLGVRPGVANN